MEAPLDGRMDRLTGHLSLRYLLALSMVAVLSMSAYGIVRTILREQASDAPVINLAGRQRMLSQKLAKEVLLMAQSRRTEDRALYRRELAATVATWDQVHRGLQSGVKELKLPPHSSKAIDSLFSEINPSYLNLKHAAESILSLGAAQLARLAPDDLVVQDIVTGSPRYLAMMDRIVFQYDHEAQQRVQHLEQHETAILVAILALLTLEGLFIFRPMVCQVRRTYGDYERSNQRLAQEISERRYAEEELQKAHDSLERRVEERTAELREVNARLQLDIIQRRQTEETLRKSERRNRTLVQESHHRIKNNLQIICSLLNLQAQNTRDARLLAALKDSRNRIRAMSLIHERLYPSSDLTRIELSEYLRSLTEDLVGSYRTHARAVSIEFDLSETTLGFDTAVSCGLIVNELVSNSLKHGFPNGRPGRIRVGLRRSDDTDSVVLTVGDDGIGLPAGVSPEDVDTLGLQLVHALTTQLEGTVEVHDGEGTAFEIRFPLTTEETAA